MEMNLLAILWSSGIIVKVVLFLLIACSVYSWAIILQKRKYMKVVLDKDKEFMEHYRTLQGFSEIKSKADSLPDSCIATMFSKGHGEFTQIKERVLNNGNLEDLKNYFKDNGVDALERSLKSGMNVANQKLSARLNVLATISSVAPFIGLFGTVWGIIDSFAGLAQGGGSIEAVAPGIAEALVATAVGLAAAIPAMWFYNIFTTEIERHNTDMENFGQDFLNLVSRNVLISKVK